MTQDGAAPPKVIDARGLNCPLPVLRLRKYLLTAPAGADVELIATDRAALRDVPAFCAAHGHSVRTLPSVGGDLRFAVTAGEMRKI
jgi:tRNA 2-thiouridine synthesizing protein A